MRAYVNVPQNYVPSVKIGTKAQIAVPEYPGKSFAGDGRGFRAGRSISRPARRACCSWSTIETGELMTGAFANVRLELPNPEAAIHVPASALIFDQKGLRVATVDAEDRVVLKQVTIARDLGRRSRSPRASTARGPRRREPAGRHRDGDPGAHRRQTRAGNAAETATKRQRKLRNRFCASGAALPLPAQRGEGAERSKSVRRMRGLVKWGDTQGPSPGSQLRCSPPSPRFAGRGLHHPRSLHRERHPVAPGICGAVAHAVDDADAVHAGEINRSAQSVSPDSRGL